MRDIYELEKKSLDLMIDLRKKYGMTDIKGEFEAEGSSLNDIQRLRRITLQAKTKLYVKIGGVEALRDIYDCCEIGVDGIIAPMVETKFAAKKFLDSIEKVEHKKKIYKISINIETVTGFNNIDQILSILSGHIDNITIGRSDLSSSYFEINTKPNSQKILNLIKKIILKCKKHNISTTVGGNVNNQTRNIFQKDLFYQNNLNKIETRKVIINPKIFVKNKNSLKKALEFEKLYILLKKEYMDMRIKSEMNRLSELKNRL